MLKRTGEAFLCCDFFKRVRASSPLRGVVVGLVAALLITDASSCAEPLQTRFNSRTSADHAAPIERLLVMTAISNVGLEGMTYEVFESNLRTKLELCGIRSKVLQSKLIDVEATTHVGEAADELRPDAMMKIRGISNLRTADRTRLYFDLQLSDIASDRVLWLAKLAFDVQGDSVWFEDSAAGNRLAIGIVSQLRDDRVIRGCPASWQGSSKLSHESK